ncbi:MAG: Nif11-like leader peptide family natural product precursor [Hydrococcus sp. C42_A2020_068]|uniref:Nif11-like leader peptide family natural product precursor n=1 Tax=Pleurocapsa sp. PCC 7327 TaxID=118163 RepID=UPI00029FEF5F|nr:Nif11-like leader peptide family natural product precursor [Pleurocapsa sp. PCC 7327]AFY76810.1 bacteriocin propeptide, TIGR03798 family [Pleurocapsa sp. PCC 7327]MBF2019797.1 Nif11-like leader peptide family natural product precursor [Hydrococcus sp. C42_A2020_068]
MSSNILEKVKEFFVRLVKDDAFQSQLQNNSIDEVRNILQEAGYIFSKEEFETATIELLDLKERDEFHELTEEELVTAVGGVTGGSGIYGPIQAMYGAVVGDPKPGKDWGWRFPSPLPKPSPIPSPWKPPVDVQPMYGVVVSNDS